MKGGKGGRVRVSVENKCMALLCIFFCTCVRLCARVHVLLGSGTTKPNRAADTDNDAVIAADVAESAPPHARPGARRLVHAPLCMRAPAT